MSDWKLKIALIDSCNHNCFYCSVKRYFPYSILNNQNVKRIIYAAKEVFDIEKVIYTGGEPLLIDNLPCLVRDVTKMLLLKDVTQVVETNAFDSKKIKEVVSECNSSLFQFRITFPTIDSIIMKNITLTNNLHDVISSVEFLENSKILTHLHYPLIKKINSQTIQIKNIIEKYIDYNYVMLFFDELVCDFHNNLVSEDYIVTKTSFESLIKKFYFEFAKQSGKISQYKKNEKSIFFVNNSCFYGEDDNHTIYITPNGFIRKDHFFDDCNQIKIENFNTEAVLSSMQNFKDTYWRDV